MIAHMLKLVWNRRRANLLIMAEILVAFLVVAAVATASAHYLHQYRQPIGYQIDDVLTVEVRHPFSADYGLPVPAEVPSTLRQLLPAVRELPEVVAVAGAGAGPARHGSRSQQTFENDQPGSGLVFDVDTVTDDFARVLGLDVIRGRWFDKGDDGASDLPVVMNQKMAEDFYGTIDVVGRIITSEPDYEGGPRRPLRIVGVIAGYKQQGDFSAPVRYLLRRAKVADQALDYNNLFLKVQPGTTAAFEAKLEDRLRAIAKGNWTFRVQRLDSLRDGYIKATLRPVGVAGLIAAFLMLMVALGLTGVLWQTVTQRTREIGLRRAKGATRGHIYAQILGELLLMTTIAVGFGGLVLAHLPLLAVIEDVAPIVYLQGGAAAMVIIFTLTTLCAVYPARLATRLEPALALHQD